LGNTHQNSQIADPPSPLIGKSVNEIAEQLSLGAASISSYRARILTKMKMKHVAELTHYAIKNRLAD
jgi:DNA-binding NarL/FixJ family response regulator